jgi:hypothetical protein
MTEKTKCKGQPKRYHTLRWIGGGLLLSVVGIVILAILGPILYSGEIKQLAPPPEIMPTIEYLHTNPFNNDANLTVNQNANGFTDILCVRYFNRRDIEEKT